MRTTRIFKVDYFFIEEFDGKGHDKFRETKNVKSKDAAEAIGEVRAILAKVTSYIDDETKKKVKVTRRGFDPINVTLEAETND